MILEDCKGNFLDKMKEWGKYVVCEILFITFFICNMCTFFPGAINIWNEEQETSHLKSIYKILLLGHQYLDISYSFENLCTLQPHLNLIFSLTMVKLFLKYFPSVGNVAKNFSSDRFGSCLFGTIKFLMKIFCRLENFMKIVRIF